MTMGPFFMVKVALVQEGEFPKKSLPTSPCTFQQNEGRLSGALCPSMGTLMPSCRRDVYIARGTLLEIPKGKRISNVSGL